MKDLQEIIRLYERTPDQPFALATLVDSRGSSYRRPGARMLISEHGASAGSLSGGCLEEEVQMKAREVLQTGRAEWMSFDTRRRFGCNGRLEILVEKVAPVLLRQIASHLRERRVFWLGVDLVRRCSELIPCPDAAPSHVAQLVEPSIRLVLIGTGPDDSAFAAMASAMGWVVEYAESAADLRERYDAWTAAVIKTHNYGRDFAALRSLLPLGLPYIGLLGPRARREQLLGDLLDTGVHAGPNLFAPVGLALGEAGPEGVALSIISEIQAVLNQGSARHLRDLRCGIHQTALAHTATSSDSPYAEETDHRTSKAG